MTKKQKKSLILNLFIIFTVLIFPVSSLFADFEMMTMGGQASRGPVEFTHEAHMDNFECLDCHHSMENGENVLDEADLEEGNPEILCGHCHNDKSGIARREAFHRQCMGCHNSQQLTSETPGPTLCGECHLVKKPQS